MGIPLELIIGLICLVIGLFTGFLISSLRNDRDAQNARLESIATLSTEPEKGVHLFHATPEGPLQVKLDGRQFHTIHELTPRFRNTLEEIALDFYKWLGYSLPSLSVVSGERSTAMEPESVAVQEIGYASIPFSGETQLPLEPRAKSIVSQINDILQEKLAASAYTGKTICLVEYPNKGIVVQVGLEQYPEVDDVPDPVVRELIRTSVAEWEKLSF